MIITKEDIQLVLYGEVVKEISRENDALIEEQINAATDEIFGYLHRYDTDTIFSEEWQNAHFKKLCVNVIAWYLVTLATPGVRLELIRQNYEDTTDYLVKVQKGSVRPNWPLRPEDPATNIDDAGNVQYSSNPKRRNHF